MLDVKIKFRLNPSPIGGCGEDAWILTYNNSRIGLAKLIIFLCYFYLFMIALYVTINEYFLIVGGIKNWKSQWGEM